MDRFVNLKFIYDLSSCGKRSVLDWCMDAGLIAREYKCPKCECAMKLIERVSISDGFEWLCHMYGENEHHIRRSVRMGTWFSNSNLTLVDILVITYLWVNETPNNRIVREANVSKRTVIDWKSFCREICMEMCVRDSAMLGGVGVVVEIIESKLGRRKYARGKNVKGNWIYVGIERGTNKYFFHVVENRTKLVLLDIVKTFISPGTIIFSECWEKYKCLMDEGFVALQDNHSTQLKHLDPSESIWKGIRKKLKCKRIAADQFEFYVAEYMWRKRENADGQTLIRQFLAAVIAVYPPKTQD